MKKFSSKISFLLEQVAHILSGIKSNTKIPVQWPIGEASQCQRLFRDDQVVGVWGQRPVVRYRYFRVFISVRIVGFHYKYVIL
jgi:hypothetical protein